MRLFVAIELPDEAKSHLTRLQLKCEGVRWLPPEQLHLTLSFLGEVAEERLDEILRRLDMIEARAFELVLDGTGCFPNSAAPRVLWAGLRPEPGLIRLAEQVRTAVADCGVVQEERRFSPHITLARIKGQPPSDRFIREFLDRKVGGRAALRFVVSECVLFRSILAPQGAQHITLHSTALRSETLTSPP